MRQVVGKSKNTIEVQNINDKDMIDESKFYVAYDSKFGFITITGLYVEEAEEGISQMFWIPNYISSPDLNFFSSCCNTLFS